MSEIAVAEHGTRLQKFLDRAGLRGFPWKTAIILYTISWGWMFIVRNSLWADDWWRFPNHFDYPWSTYGHAPWLKYEKFMFDLLGVSGSRTFIFVTFFVTALFLFAISTKLSALSLAQVRFLVVLFLVVPFNSARVSLMCIHYSNSLLLFFFAWYLLISFESRKTYFLSMVLFFLSFGMHSLLLFYFLPVLHKFLLSKVRSERRLLLFARANFLMFVLPISYWMMRSIFWPEEVNYHDVSLTRLSGTTYFVLFSGGLLLIIFLMQRRLEAMKQALQVIFAGILCLFFGIFAYVVYGVFPLNWSFFSRYITTFLARSDWDSRHQTLQPLGAALLIVGFIGLLPKFLRKFTRKVQAIILAVCVLFNVGFGFEYVVDYAKQKKVISAMKEKGESKSWSNYQFVDQTTLLNARGRAYRQRDWEGLIWLAHGVKFKSMVSSQVVITCQPLENTRSVLIQGPETHWEALKTWVSDGDMGFRVTVDDTPGACKPGMSTSEPEEINYSFSEAIPILFYFTGAKD